MPKFLASKTSVTLNSFDAVANLKYVLRLLIVSGTMEEYIHIWRIYDFLWKPCKTLCPARIREEVKYSSSKKTSNSF